MVPANVRPGSSSTVTFTGKSFFTDGASVSGIATSMRTVLKSISVTTAALLDVLLEVAAGMSAPGSTQRFVITPENGAVIFA